MRILLLLVVVFFGVVAVLIPGYLSPNDLRACDTPEPLGACSKVDAIVVVSGGDTPARTNEAIKLYKAGWSDLLIFSGAAADPEGPSNAEAMKRRALNAGIDSSNILTEGFSRTTSENAANTTQFIAERGLKKIILTTSPYHQRRTSLEFRAKLGDGVAIINHPTTTDRQWKGFWWWTTPSGWWLVGGELVKITAFYTSQGASRL